MHTYKHTCASAFLNSNFLNNRFLCRSISMPVIACYFQIATVSLRCRKRMIVSVRLCLCGMMGYIRTSIVRIADKTMSFEHCALVHARALCRKHICLTTDYSNYTYARPSVRPPHHITQKCTRQCAHAHKRTLRHTGRRHLTTHTDTQCAAPPARSPLHTPVPPGSFAVPPQSVVLLSSGSLSIK